MSRCVGGESVGESVVDGRLAVDNLSLCRWSVDGGLLVIGGSVINKFSASMNMFWPHF